MLLVNIEDLWLVRKPQNIPGSGHSYPNWRQKARYKLADFERLPRLVGMLREIKKQREGG